MNTAMFVVKEKKSGKYYFKWWEKLWYSADSPLGPWEYEKKVSNKLKKLKKEHFTENSENSEDDLDVPVEKEGTNPKIVVSQEPAETYLYRW